VKQRKDEEGLTVVDHYVPTSVGDLSHPNATLGIAIAGDAPRYRVEEESFFTTTETNPFRLKVGENKEILRLKEAGEIISIEIIADNPFLQVHLELDDYRVDEKGITAAELLGTGRTTYADMEFAAKKLPSGDYSLIYAPRTNTVYTDSLKLKIANRLTDPKEQGLGSFKLRSEPQLRGGLPKLSKRSYLGGTYVDIPQIAPVPQFEADGIDMHTIIRSALTRGLDWDLYDNQYNNEPGTTGVTAERADYGHHRFNIEARGQTQTTLTSLNPYTGNVGNFYPLDGMPLPESFARIVFFPKGVAASTTTDAPGADVNFQQIAIYAASSLTVSAESESDAVDILDSQIIESAIYIRDKGRIYFPGSVINLAQYKSSTGTFVYDQSGDGCWIIAVEGGLDFVPEKVGLGGPSISGPPSLAGFGTIQMQGLLSDHPSNGMIVRKIIVKRKRKKSLV